MVTPEITQSDREMAATLLIDDWREFDAELVRSGRADDWAIAVLFARHREAAFARGVKAGLEAAARGFRAAQCSPAPYTDGMAAITRIDPATIKEEGHD